MTTITRRLFWEVYSKLSVVIAQRPFNMYKTNVRCMSSKIKPPTVYDGGFDETSNEFWEDKLEEKVNQPGAQIHGRNLGRKAAFLEAEKQHRKFIKRKIIEKKEQALFGQKQPSLLTWAARSQIKYLNKTDPDYWTPEMLADSFPVSKEVIIKILKSSKVPYDDKEIFQHDQRVYRNWLKLKKAKKMLASGGPVDPEYICIVENAKFSQMKNAAGSKSLPMPDRASLLLTQTAVAERRKPKIRGEFSAILDDYERDREELKTSDKLKQIGIEDPEYMPLLEEISENSVSDQNVKETDKRHEEIRYRSVESDQADVDVDIEDFLDIDFEMPNERPYLNEYQYSKQDELDEGELLKPTRRQRRTSRH